MDRHCIHLDPGRRDHYRLIAEQTGLSVNEVMRRLLDSACREDRLNESFPRASGMLGVK
jgi:hypothetical protein